MPTARSSVTGNTYVRLRRNGRDIWARLDSTILVAHIGFGRGVCAIVHRDGDLRSCRLSNLDWRQAQRQGAGEKGAAPSADDLYDLWPAGWQVPATAKFFEADEARLQVVIDDCLAREIEPALSGRCAAIDLDTDLPF